MIVQRVVFFLLLFMVIVVHATLLSSKRDKHLNVVDKHAKVQHITLARMSVKQAPVKKSLPVVEKKLLMQEKEHIKPKKSPKKVLKKPKKMVKKQIKKSHKISKKKKRHKKRKYLPKEKRQKVYANKESLVTLKDKYVNQIRTKIRKRLIYPAIAKRMRMEEVVTVSFTVYQNGQIGNIQVLKGEKSILRKSAVKTLKKIAIKAIPHQLGLTKLELKLPISFKIIKG